MVFRVNSERVSSLLQGSRRLTADDVEHFVSLALTAIGQEYPTHLSLYARCDEDVAPAWQLTPIFFGAFDWHSSVHGHWTLARCARTFPEADWAERCKARLDQSIREDLVEEEREYLDPHPTFERPYGLAWLLCLHGELTSWAANDGDVDAERWARTLAPLARIARKHFATWLPRLRYPVRSGVHSQTAFALGLAFDWARENDSEFETLIRARAVDLYGDDRDYPLHLEPCGEDFLSASLGAADLMRRVLPRAEFQVWWERTMHSVENSADWLAPIEGIERGDGRLCHLDGLHLSRAFMLKSVAAALDPALGDLRKKLEDAARLQSLAGLSAIEASSYEGTHWLGSFAVYLLT
jgi:hypothetical protein